MSEQRDENVLGGLSAGEAVVNPSRGGLFMDGLFPEQAIPQFGIAQHWCNFPTRLTLAEFETLRDITGGNEEARKVLAKIAHHITIKADF